MMSRIIKIMLRSMNLKMFYKIPKTLLVALGQTTLFPLNPTQTVFQYNMNSFSKRHIYKERKDQKA